MGEGVRDFIEDEADERVPEGLSAERADRFIAVVNNALAAGESETRALRRGREGLKTPEDREKEVRG